MKVAGVLTAGLVLALAPTGTAFAGDGPNGKAYGNCARSSAGGQHLASGAAGNGNGGMVRVAVAGECERQPGGGTDSGGNSGDQAGGGDIGGGGIDGNLSEG